MAMIPRYLLRGLGVTTCDSGGGVSTHHSHIITSEYDWETRTFGKLGTVMSISSKGYDAFINSEAENPYKEARECKFAGASRICVYADGGYPLEILAFLGFYSDGDAIFWPGYYETAGTVPDRNIGGYSVPAAPIATSRFYITPVYDPDKNAISLFLGADAGFTVTDRFWPFSLKRIEEKTNLLSDESDEYIPWIMSKVQACPYDADLSYLAPLPGPVLENCGTGETGIIIGVEAHYVRGTGDEITEEIVDVSDQATYTIVPAGAAWLDENRELILADWATSAGIIITWDGMPGELVNIPVLRGTWDDMGGDEGDDGTGGDGGGGTDPGGDGGGGSGGDSGDDDTGDDGGGTGGDGGGGDTGDDTTGAVSVEALREAFMRGMATMAALYSRHVQKEPVAYLYNGVRLAAVTNEWDKGSFPYLVMTLKNDRTLLGLIYSNVPVYMDADGQLRCQQETRYILMPYANWETRTDPFRFKIESAQIKYAGNWIGYPIAFWSNYDILNEDGTVALAASEPIPVYK